MSTSLIALIPVILLGIVGMLCFVGCTLPVEGLPSPPFTQYSDLTVLSNGANLIAYWPLNDQLTDQSNPAPALERQSHIPSSYIDMATAPELYQWPAFDKLPNPPGLDVKSDAAPGTILFSQPGIVKGDAVVPALPSALQPCVVVNGCYVEVPFVDKLLADTAFTVEAWVRVGWSANDPDAWRFVVEGRDFPGKGFALFAKTEDNSPHVYRWAGIVGNGAADATGFTTVTSELTIALSGGEGGVPADPVYLALTFDGQMLKLFVDGKPQGQIQIPSTYVPSTVQPIWIGAGAPFVARRPTQAAGMPGSPLFPFVGAIQDVALYRIALSAGEIDTHFRNGSGKA
jgi:hypothetical protein